VRCHGRSGASASAGSPPQPPPGGAGGGGGGRGGAGAAPAALLPPPPIATLYGHLAAASIYDGATLRGVVQATYVRGRRVYAAAGSPGGPPRPASAAAEPPATHRSSGGGGGGGGGGAVLTGSFRERPIGHAVREPEWFADLVLTWTVSYFLVVKGPDPYAPHHLYRFADLLPQHRLSSMSGSHSSSPRGGRRHS